MHTAIATKIIPMSTTPPTPPTAGQKIGACVGACVVVGVAIEQCA